MIERHVLLRDSVILARAEFDKCIGHMRSRKPRPHRADVLFENVAGSPALPQQGPGSAASNMPLWKMRLRAALVFTATPLTVSEEMGEVGNKRMTLRSHLRG